MSIMHRRGGHCIPSWHAVIAVNVEAGEVFMAQIEVKSIVTFYCNLWVCLRLAALSSGGRGKGRGGVAEDLGANKFITTRRATAIGETRQVRGCKFHDSEYERAWFSCLGLLHGLSLILACVWATGQDKMCIVQGLTPLVAGGFDAAESLLDHDVLGRRRGWREGEHLGQALELAEKCEHCSHRKETRNQNMVPGTHPGLVRRSRMQGPGWNFD
jgi:hypothetical protein